VLKIKNVQVSLNKKIILDKLIYHQKGGDTYFSGSEWGWQKYFGPKHMGNPNYSVKGEIIFANRIY
jgi:hypothetical protein